MRMLIGADPEVFLQKNGSIISAYGVIDGTKLSPQPVESGAVQVDGMALEFNIDPAEDSATFIDNINHVYSQLEGMIPEGTELAIVPTAHFTEEYMKDQPYAATELGCDPDYNAYTRERNPRPNGDVTFRTGAGHIHIGWMENMNPFDEGHYEACIMLTKQLDILLGLFSPLWDDDTERRSLYGKLGSFRPKPYGVEYRVLSNAWLKSDDLKALVFDLTEFAFDKLMGGYRYYEYDDLRVNLLSESFRNGVFEEGYFRFLDSFAREFVRYNIYNRKLKGLFLRKLGTKEKISSEHSKYTLGGVASLDWMNAPHGSEARYIFVSPDTATALPVDIGTLNSGVGRGN